MKPSDKIYKVSNLIAKEQDDGHPRKRWVGREISCRSRMGQEPPQPLSAGHNIQTENAQILYILQGWADFTINMTDLRLKAGMVIVLTKDTILQMKEKSGEFDMEAIYFSDDTIGDIMKERIPPLFRFHMQHYLLFPNEDEQALFRALTEGLYTSLPTSLARTRTSLIAAIINFVHELYLKSNTGISDIHAHNVKILNQFLDLLGKHCDTHRDLDFYAGEISLNKHYLSSIISDMTKKKARQWIEEVTIAHIKSKLRHTTKTIQEIAFEMNFPEPSHLTRYFKRATGMTPAEYRQWK